MKEPEEKGNIDIIERGTGKEKIIDAPEIDSYLQRESGQIMVIKGETGSGKSILAMECLITLARKKKLVYASTRLSKENVVSDSPWLVKAGAEVLDMGDEMLDPAKFLMRLEQMAREKPLAFVVDTWDALREKYRVPEEKEETLLQIVKNENINLILVVESTEKGFLDYLADGIVRLEKEKHEGRLIRTMHIEKLRGLQVLQETYLFSLYGGRLTVFPSFNALRYPHRKWVKASDPEGGFSSGIPDLDELLEPSGMKGIRRGSYMVMEVTGDLSWEEYFIIPQSFFLNFLAHGRGAIAILAAGVPEDLFREHIVRYIEPEIFDRLVRIGNYTLQESNKPYVIPLLTKDMNLRKERWKRAEIDVGMTKGVGVIEYHGFDTLEYLYGEQMAVRDLMNGIASVRIRGNLGLGLVRPGLKLAQAVKNMADFYFKVLKIHNALCMYGEKPLTNIHAIAVDPEKGMPHIRLVPIR